MFLTDEHAKANKESGYEGRKYRPSNGMEGEIFYDCFCANCTKDVNQDCKILGGSYCFSLKDDNYPEELQYDSEGQPTCTSFVSKKDS